MKKLAKIFGFIILGVILLFIFITRFSTVESRIRCEGNTVYNKTSHPLTIYFILTEYRPWIFWSNSDGNIKLEIPNEWNEYYPYLKKIGYNILIYEEYPQLELRGNYSELSKALAIDLKPPFGFFDGNCTAENEK